jgi:hypothetical protein
VAQGDSMLGQSGSGAWKVRAGKGGKYRLARNLGMCNYKHDDSTGIEKLENCHLLVDDHQKLKISFYFFTWEIYNGSITFLYLAFSPTVLNQSAKKPDFSLQRNA